MSADGLGPARGILLALVVGTACWLLLFLGGWMAMRWLM